MCIYVHIYVCVYASPKFIFHKFLFKETLLMIPDRGRKREKRRSIASAGSLPQNNQQPGWTITAQEPSTPSGSPIWWAGPRGSLIFNCCLLLP